MTASTQWTAAGMALRRYGAAASFAAVAATFAVAAGILQSAFFIPRVPAWAVVLTVAYSVLSFFRPFPALLILIGIIPLVNIAGQLWNAPVPWLEVVVLAFFVGWLPRSMGRHRDAGMAPPTTAAFAVVIVASMIVHAAALIPAVPSVPSASWHLLFRDYLIERNNLPALQQGALLLEGLGLLTATSLLAGRHRENAAPVLRMIVAAATGAAALTILRVLMGAVRTGEPWAAAAEYFVNLRFSAEFRDVNAAGSHLVLALLIGVGLALHHRASRVIWLVSAAVLVIGLWLTGSRIAIVAALTAVGAMVLIYLKCSFPERTGYLRLPLVIVLGIAVTVPVIFSGRILRSDTSRSVQIRTELAATAGRMLRSAPLFGIGIGQFYEQSAVFSSPALLAIYPRENAHNNYLQIAAELGCVGVVAFCWLLWTVFGRLPVAAYVRTARYVELGAVCGLGAFLMTALTGHPLLTPEVAYTFWIALGLTYTFGGRLEKSDLQPLTMKIAVPAAIVIIVACSLPWRIHEAIRGADLEHVEFGFDGWSQDGEGHKYHAFSREAVLFLPASSPRAWLPMRAADRQTGTAVVHIKIDGRPANAVVVGATWQRILIVTGAGDSSARFRKIELTLEQSRDPASEKIVVWVGRPEVQGP